LRPDKLSPQGQAGTRDDGAWAGSIWMKASAIRSGEFLRALRTRPPRCEKFESCSPSVRRIEATQHPTQLLLAGGRTEKVAGRQKHKPENDLRHPAA
jgi:hypothetical protein